jgi:predicted Zn-dependent peptidase
VYDVRAGSNSYPGLGYSYISFEALQVHLDETLSLVIQEVGSFVANGPTEEELRFAKNYLTSQWLMTFDHPSSIAEWVESHLLWDDKCLLPEDYVHLIANITVEDIIEFMNRYWDLSRINLTIQGPINNSKLASDNYLQMLSRLGDSRFNAYTIAYS